MRAFLVRLPSLARYWAVVDDSYRVVAAADGYLQHLRLGQDAAGSTTKAYAEALALYLRWCEQTSRDWRTAADRLGGFITWLKHTPGDPDAPVTGPGVKDVRGAGRINRILTVVRGFLRHGVVIGEVPGDVLAILYDISDDRHLPVDVRGENSSLRYVARPRHRLSETETAAGRATDAEVVALLRACRSARIGSSCWRWPGPGCVVANCAGCGARTCTWSPMPPCSVARSLALTCTFTAVTIPTGRGRSRAGRASFPLMNCWCWLMTATGSSGRTAALREAATSCW